MLFESAGFLARHFTLLVQDSGQAREHSFAVTMRMLSVELISQFMDMIVKLPLFGVYREHDQS